MITPQDARQIAASSPHISELEDKLDAAITKAAAAGDWPAYVTIGELKSAWPIVGAKFLNAGWKIDCTFDQRDGYVVRIERPVEQPTAPHQFRRKALVTDRPYGPLEETCADCGTDPRNTIHKVSADPRGDRA